jgi:hypothetical protein
MHAIRLPRRPTHLPLPHIRTGAAQSRLPHPPLPPAGARRCAPWSVAPTRVRAPRKPPPTPLGPSHAHALAGQPASSPALRPPRPSATSLAADHRRSRFPPSQPANRLRVSPNPTLAAYSPESGRPSPPAALAPPPETSMRRLKSSQGPAYKNQGPNCKKNLKP